MSKVSLLDCTLRDGGFVNEWNFGHGNMINLLERSVSAGIDYIEVGFIDAREEFDINRSITPDTDGINRLYSGVDKGNSKLIAMIDYGTVPIERVCRAQDSVLDGIRVMIKKKTRYEALEYCRALQEKGYLVFAQPVSITGYADDEMEELTERVSESGFFAMSIVDTYGLLDRSKLLHYFEIMDRVLDKDVMIGYHAHNNFQLAYANSISLIEEVSDRRALLIDGSAFGMGKSAGNCPLELLTMYANEHLKKDYDTNQVLEMIDTCIRNIFALSPWGYQMQYYLCASNDCHPKYSQYLMQKKTLSVKSINDILKMIDPKERLVFNQKHIEELYLKYQRNDINDSGSIETLKKELAGKTILITGPGKSIVAKREEIRAYTEKNDPVIISINTVFDDYGADYIFITNSKRYMQISGSIGELCKKGMKVIATSNVTPARDRFDLPVDYSSLIDEKSSIPDNSLPMLLRLLCRAEVKRIALAGFDGYLSEAKVNYYNEDMEYDFAHNYALQLNRYTADMIKELRGQGMEIEFVTESKYEEG